MKNISCPPVSRLVSELRLDKETAKALRERIKRGYAFDDYGCGRSHHYSHTASAFMAELSKLAEFHGEESLYPDAPGVFYLNSGDCYASTLIFRPLSASVRIGCIGDIIERLPASRREY